jgi:hypothetical protein
MKRHAFTRVFWGAVLVLIMTPLWAQGQAGNMVHSWPDSLVLETYTGTVIIDDSGIRSIYYLDVDGDTVSDYHLSFGPWWFEPTSGAVRPVDGQEVTIVAAEWDCCVDNTLMVFELDGLEWREPVEYGQQGWNMLPVWESSVPLFTVTGTVMVDTTYYYNHFYLDVDGDELPEYKLGFGPAWFEPASGAVRPEDGDIVTVSGRVHYTSGIDILAVFEIDGLVWREFQKPAPWAGKWVKRDNGGHQYAYARNDSSQWVDFPPGHMSNGPGGNGPGGNGPGGNAPWPDSMFVEFWNIHPDSIPGIQHMEQNQKRVMAMYMHAHDPQGNAMMNGRYGQQNGRMRFMEQNTFRFQIRQQNAAGKYAVETLRVMYWDLNLQDWVDVYDFTMDESTGVISFATEDLYTYYVVVSSSTVTDTEPASELPDSYDLGQNYPNPFNPETIIPFTLPATQHIVLRVYDTLGREVRTLVDGVLPAGIHTVTFNAVNLPSGVYLYQIRGEGWTSGRQMLLLK